MESIVHQVAHMFYYLFLVLSSAGGFVIRHSTECLLVVLCTWGFYFICKYVLQIRVSIHPATVDTFDRMVCAFRMESMFAEESDSCVVGIGNIDSDLAPDALREDIKIVRSSRRVSYAVRVAHVAKAQVGLLANTRANELVYSRLCREEMVKHGVRPSHIAHMVPLAVAACFIPLDSDFLASSIRQCEGMQEKRAQLGPSWGK